MELEIGNMGLTAGKYPRRVLFLYANESSLIQLARKSINGIPSLDSRISVNGLHHKVTLIHPSSSCELNGLPTPTSNWCLKKVDKNTEH